MLHSCLAMAARVAAAHGSCRVGGHAHVHTRVCSKGVIGLVALDSLAGRCRQRFDLRRQSPRAASSTTLEPPCCRRLARMRVPTC